MKPCRRLSFKGRILVLCCIICLLFYMQMFTNTSFEQNSSNIEYFADKTWKNKTRKLILLWTKFWSLEYWTEVDKFGIPPCASRCDITVDKSRIEEADAVLFHWGNLWWYTDLPIYRRSDQVWVFYNAEPLHKQSNLAPWRNVFNWSMSYRTDSTVFSPFGIYFEMTDKEKAEAREKFSNRNFAMEKKSNISMTYSNCYDDARRYRTADNINKYIKIDIFGRCGGKDDCKFNTPECNSKLSSYKFHLALDNSFCKDYFSEKFWECLEKDVIPIVAWKQSPGKLVPPKSYINIFDFPDIKSFAKFIESLMRNDAEYNSYFEWKQKYTFTNTYNRHWCPLCDALFNSTIPHQVVKDPYRWLADDFCEPVSIRQWIGIIVDRWLFDLGF
ncbi:hypothetical protein CHS0354_034444 [Potamilus streckersoni]|uniref:Fucosyltransferase n=1 Tax=Potamilus streckersoni TaxID=2493646 RepID=A0AAE0S8I8_9BIVA|nr:hypothetical protein CHS0354_034444 [Potamilus streckersoni]